MQYGTAHVDGLYTVPNGSGTQFTDGAVQAQALGLQAFKVYCTQQYATQYPFQSAWSAVPTTCKQLLQTTQYQNVLARPFQTIAITIFSFGNPPNNWWRDAGGADNARLQIEENELYDAAVHLLTTYNNSGKTFIFQTWEGDWALMDSFDPTTYVAEYNVTCYAAFLSARQRAVERARRDTPHTNVRVLNAFEVNRVLDVADNPGRRRILKDILPLVQPDLVSYSAYDSTIATYGYGANQAEWTQLCNTYFTKALRLIKTWAPNSGMYIGEFGFEENRIAIEHPSYHVDQMVDVVASIALAEGCSHLFYWEMFDNEADLIYGGTKGYFLIKPDGSTSLAGQAMQALAAGA